MKKSVRFVMGLLVPAFMLAGMTRVMLGTVLFALMAAAAFPQSAALPDEQIWSGFEQWVAALKPLPPGQSVPIQKRYVESQVAAGVPAEEAARRYERMNTIRWDSTDRMRTYWDGAFKSGAGPSNPLRLLQETITGMKPGKALDSGMGSGRNAIYLASIGWDVTGYDMSKEALRAAQESAAAAGVKLTTKEAKHDTFDFGEDQWDLIVCSYNALNPHDKQWPPVFLRALRRGGIAVFQGTGAGQPPSLPRLLDNWKGFHVLRIEDVDAGVITDEWRPSLRRRTVRLVIRKE